MKPQTDCLSCRGTGVWTFQNTSNAGQPWGPVIFEASSGAYHLETTGRINTWPAQIFLGNRPSRFRIIHIKGMVVGRVEAISGRVA